LTQLVGQPLLHEIRETLPHEFTVKWS